MTNKELHALLLSKVGKSDASTVLMELIEGGVIQKRYAIPYMVRMRLRLGWRQNIGRMNAFHREVATEFDVDTMAVYRQGLKLLREK